MSQLFESLESRRLFSASPVAVMRADERAAKVDLIHLSAVSATIFQPISGDLIKARELAGNASTLAKTKKSTLGYAKLLRQELALVQVGLLRPVNTLIAQGALAKHFPSNTKLAAKVTSDKATFQAAASNSITVLSNVLQAFTGAIATGFNTITTAEAANTQLQGDVSTQEGRIQTAVNQFTTDANNAYTTDVANILAGY